MKQALSILACVVLIAACSSSGGQPRSGRSTQDARVKSYRGQTPPDVFTNGSWVSEAGATSLGQLRGRVVYVQFAFPQ